MIDNRPALIFEHVSARAITTISKDDSCDDTLVVFLLQQKAVPFNLGRDHLRPLCQSYNHSMLAPIVRTKVLGICLAIALLLPTTCFGEINMEAVRRSVVFLYAADASGQIVPAGTGFIVEIPSKSHVGQAYKLLVTARHIVDPEWAGCPIQGAPKLFMRVNKKNFDPTKDEVGTVDLDLAGNIRQGNPWVVNPDSEVDAAVATLDGSVLDKYDVGAVLMSDFPTAEEIKTFNVKDEVVSAGLLPGASGKKHNYPISKFGHLSSLPAESVDAKLCGEQAAPRSLKVWIVAASLVPGNSGSPIFFSPQMLSSRRAVLLGVQSIALLPWDVAGMTPIQYVYEIIESMTSVMKDADLTRNHQPKKP